MSDNTGSEDKTPDDSAPDEKLCPEHAAERDDKSKGARKPGTYYVQVGKVVIAEGTVATVACMVTVLCALLILGTALGRLAS